MNRVYRDLLFNLAERAVRDASSISGLLHSGLKGQLRELFVRELLEPMMPKEYVVGSGNIISSYDDISRQIDVVVCDRRILPPILYESALGMFPIESALMTIEVKSKLNACRLKSSHASAEAVAKFQHQPPIIKTGSGVEAKYEPDVNYKPEHVIPYLFAFSSDLEGEGKTELERYIELIGEGEPTLRGICVLGRGFWFWSDGRSGSRSRSATPRSRSICRTAWDPASTTGMRTTSGNPKATRSPRASATTTRPATSRALRPTGNTRSVMRRCCRFCSTW